SHGRPVLRNTPKPWRRRASRGLGRDEEGVVDGMKAGVPDGRRKLSALSVVPSARNHDYVPTRHYRVWLISGCRSMTPDIPSRIQKSLTPLRLLPRLCFSPPFKLGV